MAAAYRSTVAGPMSQTEAIADGRVLHAEGFVRRTRLEPVGDDVVGRQLEPHAACGGVPFDCARRVDERRLDQ